MLIDLNKDDSFTIVKDKMWQDFPSQIIISLIEDFEIDNLYPSEGVTVSNYIGSYLCQITELKEVYNPALTYDLEILDEFERFLESLNK